MAPRSRKKRQLPEAKILVAEAEEAYRQVLGTAHPDTQRIQRKLEIIAEMRASKSPDWDAFISRHRREA